MPPIFKRAADAPGNKPDKRGRIVVRVFLQDESASDIRAHVNNLRRDFAVEDATVSEVAAVVDKALFGGGG